MNDPINTWSLNPPDTDFTLTFDSLFIDSKRNRQRKHGQRVMLRALGNQAKDLPNTQYMKGTYK